MTPVQILAVEQRPTLWRIRASDGQMYATSSPWLASLAEQHRKAGALVHLDSVKGWYYRELRGIQLAALPTNEVA